MSGDSGGGGCFGGRRCPIVDIGILRNVSGNGSGLSASAQRRIENENGMEGTEKKNLHTYITMFSSHLFYKYSSLLSISSPMMFSEHV